MEHDCTVPFVLKGKCPRRVENQAKHTMKLFLTSSLDKVVELLVNKLGQEPSTLKVLFVANAADHYENIWWVDLDRKAFAKYNFKIEELDLRKIDAKQLQTKLDTADILHICGGSVLYLLGLLQQGKVIEVIQNSVRDGKVIYTGTSAGSMIVAPDVTLSKFDEEEQKYMDSISDYTGLNLVNFYIIPHCENAEFLASTKAMMDYLPQNKTPVLLLNDSHAVWVKDGKNEILSK